MADSGKLTRSLLGAADEVKDINCEPCRQEGNVAIAEGYCVDCSEYLCGPCYKNHRRYKALQHHVLQDKDTMPIRTDSGNTALDVCVEKCIVHPSKVIEYFCETCDQLGCHVCMIVDHRKCDRVKHIPDMVKNLDSREKFKTFDNKIKDVEKRLEENRDRITSNGKANLELEALAQQTMKQQRDMINKFFDELEKKMYEKIAHIKTQNSTTLKAATDRLDTLQAEFDFINSGIENKKNGQNCELFIAMKRNEEKMKTFDEELEKLLEERRIPRYTLLPSEQIEAMMKTTTEICRMTTARMECEIDIKTSKDTDVPCIYGLTSVYGQFCVSSDNSNRSVKVIDTRRKAVISEIRLDAEELWGLTKVSDGCIAIIVSLPVCKYQIQLFSVSASGFIGSIPKQILNTKLYFELAKSNDCFFASTFNYIDLLQSNGKIIKTIQKDDCFFASTFNYLDLLQSNGKIIKTIQKDKNGVELFEYLGGIAISPDNRTIYCTDYNKDTVTSLTLEGTVNATYKDDNLKNPLGIAVDSNGYVYVCSNGTHCIHQLTAELKKVQVLVEDVRVSKLTCSGTENKLYIGCGSHIRVLDMTP